MELLSYAAPSKSPEGFLVGEVQSQSCEYDGMIVWYGMCDSSNTLVKLGVYHNRRNIPPTNSLR